jgi:hypothetical protein
VTLCRDNAEEDVSYFQVVISNHVVARNGDFPDFSKHAHGSYTIEAKNKCEERPLHLGGTISWSRESRLIIHRQPDLPDWERHVTVSGTANVVILVTDTGYIYDMTVERGSGSTYSYNYEFREFGDPETEECITHETGTLETYAGVPDADFGDWSIGRLNPIGGLFEDIILDFEIRDWCGPQMGRNIPEELRNKTFVGFITCPEDEFDLTAEFDGTSSYVVDCSYTYDRSVAGSTTDTGSGSVSGTLTILDGPHPTPR